MNRRNPKRNRDAAIGDLDWFFNQAESDLGISSNYSQVYAQLVAGCTAAPTTCDYDVQRFTNSLLGNVERYRDIDRIFRQLTPKSKRILEAYFDVRDFPFPVRSVFGIGIGLLLLTPSAQKTKKKPRDRWDEHAQAMQPESIDVPIPALDVICSAIAKNNKNTITRITKEAERMLSDALTEFKDLRAREPDQGQRRPAFAYRDLT